MLRRVRAWLPRVKAWAPRDRPPLRRKWPFAAAHQRQSLQWRIGTELHLQRVLREIVGTLPGQYCFARCLIGHGFCLRMAAMPPIATELLHHGNRRFEPGGDIESALTR